MSGQRLRLVAAAAPRQLLASLPLKEGLDGRLCAMASAAVRAKETGRDLVIGRVPSVEFPAAFNTI